MRTFAKLTSCLALPLGLALAGVGCVADPAGDSAERTEEIAQAATDAPPRGGPPAATNGGRDGDHAPPLGHPSYGGDGDDGHGQGYPSSQGGDGDDGRGHDYPPSRGGDGNHGYGRGRGYPPVYGGDDGHGHGDGDGSGHPVSPGYHPPHGPQGPGDPDGPSRR